MTIDLQRPDIVELKPRIIVFGVGGGGGNAVNNMINAELEGVEFVVANTDAQSLKISRAQKRIQLGVNVTAGLGAGSNPEIGRAAAEECIDEIGDHLNDSNMVFVTCGMGGGTGTGAAPVIARAARERGLLTIGVVTKPFNFEGRRRMNLANAGIEELQRNVDTLIVIPNQNLFRIINESTSLIEAFAMADQVLYSGVASVTDLMVREGLINLDFADVSSVMLNMGRAMMGTGEASGEGRALAAAEAAISNPLLDETSMHGAGGLLVSITGGRDMTLNEVDVAATRVRDEVDPDANVIVGAIVDDALEGLIRVSVVATGVDSGGEVTLSPNVTGTILPAKKAEASETPSSSGGQTSVIPNGHMPVMNFDGDDAIDEMDLEEEMAHTLEEAFRPQSQIFGQIRSEAVETSQVAPAQVAKVLSVTISPKIVEEKAPAKVVGQMMGEKSVISDMQEEQDGQARLPTIEDFSPVIQQAVQRKAAESDEAIHGPRRLWQKITQGLIQRDEGEVDVRLEPAESVAKFEGFDQGQKIEPVAQEAPASQVATPVQAATDIRNPAVRSDVLHGLSRANLQPQRGQPQRNGAQKVTELSDEEWAIPPFLRRQV